jgi:hypothetical protein
MKTTQVRKIEYRQHAKKENRLPIVADMYKKGYSTRAIRVEVMKRLDLKTYSLQTVWKDIHTLLKEWQNDRIKDTDQAVQLELSRIDDITREAWAAWDKSKKDQTVRKMKRKGLPKVSGENGSNESNGITTLEIEQRTEEDINYGDPRYLDVINKQNIERRKLLGLYAPEKRELSGGLSFGDLLMSTSIYSDKDKTDSDNGDNE